MEFVGRGNQMATWSGIRYKLETEYLALSLQGHIQYFVTNYSKSSDHEGMAGIRYNGNEIKKGNLISGVFIRILMNLIIKVLISV
jgi:hypothetical protein